GAREGAGAGDAAAAAVVDVLLDVVRAAAEALWLAPSRAPTPSGSVPDPAPAPPGSWPGRSMEVAAMSRQAADRAVVLGASMGGLLAARVLADFYRRGGVGAPDQRAARLGGRP